MQLVKRVAGVQCLSSTPRVRLALWTKTRLPGRQPPLSTQEKEKKTQKAKTEKQQFREPSKNASFSSDDESGDPSEQTQSD
jgi:hypothetical protein